MSQSPMLIIGATGSNGRALAETLTDDGIKVRAMVRDPEKARASLPDAVEIVRGDLSDMDSLTTAFDNIEKVFIVTAIHKNTVELFANSYAAAKAADVKQLVKFSGLGASMAADSDVIRQHGESDEALRASGVPFTILRPNSFFQNMLAQAGTIAATDQFYLPLGNAAQSLIDISDIAEIAKTVLTSEGHLGKNYDLTGPESLNFHDVAAIIGEVRGRPVTYTPVTPEAAQAAMSDQGMDTWSAHALAEIQALFGTGAYADVLPDAATILGREPRRFEDFIRSHVSAFASKASGEGSAT